MLDLYRDYYAGKPFVRVRNSLPATKIGPHELLGFGRVPPVRSRALILACKDNLIRGASGVAVQNFNRMCGYEEACGLL